MSRRLALFLAALAAIALVAPAPASRAATESNAAGVKRIETYLNRLETLEARFIQNNPDGSSSHGRLYIARPGRMRFEYDPPVPLLLLSNGKWLTQVDKELKQVSNYPLDETPAWLLLRDRINFGDGLRVAGFERGQKVMRIRLEDTRNPDIGSVTLTFADQPLELRSWVVTDAQGLQTELALVNTRTGMALDPNLFEYTDTFRPTGD